MQLDGHVHFCERGQETLGICRNDKDVMLDGLVSVEVTAVGDTVTVSLNGIEIAKVKDLDLHPLLGGSADNTGSIAFGGPHGWITTYRHLSIISLSGEALYNNSFLPHDAARTYADFATGINALPCTIDGAKRDRATFGGDLHIMGRSIAYSTLDFDAIRGSIDLLTSHQTG
ncbi:hypothetical protein CLAFUW4_11122 [Fulvia fulva]|uniref:Uncharacterized protein n=1 Tax=Passalora fulva TaxID=5499 RepID=A0A9Q8PCG0_PASFU|nr:uncharacterized protein CLAFUR5_10164 [Fulvia fulva]KAK4619364.1 hypothetical protein CLAFUR4_11127 [Fulvia fulva]KAK4620933.1 hypothetical protein CLAFUR0_11133 [Fulvia fulva]UJO19994.1 hypothetical protein CLAFUR5_10164 [Fulvia fulva]WPV17252.1 hypothetical protein CLAFUW4_11122 [Fulvia fulva]WPV32245.1 hypothetical protein CLAFUW7_11118 [Fulvia fulva]